MGGTLTKAMDEYDREGFLRSMRGDVSALEKLLTKVQEAEGTPTTFQKQTYIYYHNSFKGSYATVIKNYSPATSEVEELLTRFSRVAYAWNKIVSPSTFENPPPEK